MQTHLKFRVLPLLILSLLLIAGCSSVMDTVASSTGLLDTTKARVNQAALDAMGLGALEDAVLANLIYSQVFFAGGYGYGYEDFDQGEGVVWDVTSRDENGSDTIRIERALLKRNADGTAWWFLRYSAEGEDDFISEALLDDEYALLKFRYRDPETDTIREWIPEQDEEAAESEATDEESTEEPVDVGFYEGAYGDYIVGTEEVRVPAGTYRADHILIEDTWSSENEDGTAAETYEVRYEWWISDKVPGQLIKYSWANISEDVSLSGVLISNKNGYTTQLKSY